MALKNDAARSNTSDELMNVTRANEVTVGAGGMNYVTVKALEPCGQGGGCRRHAKALSVCQLPKERTVCMVATQVYAIVRGSM